MARISYVDPGDLGDPELEGYLEQARLRGAPRPEIQAIRAHQPDVLRTWTQAWEALFHDGVLDHGIKELCRSYVAQSLACDY
jgi:hypothetical protein